MLTCTFHWFTVSIICTYNIKETSEMSPHNEIFTCINSIIIIYNF
jgi:hypothetical protein